MSDTGEVITTEIVAPAKDATTHRFVPGNSGPTRTRAGTRNRIQSHMLREFEEFLQHEPGAAPLTVLAKLSLGIRPGPGGVDVHDGSVPASVSVAAAGKLLILLPRLEHVSLRSDGPLIDQRQVVTNVMLADPSVRHQLEKLALKFAAGQGQGRANYPTDRRQLAAPPLSQTADSQASIEARASGFKAPTE
jgi:hypothetical protein